MTIVKPALGSFGWGPVLNAVLDELNTGRLSDAELTTKIQSLLPDSGLTAEAVRDLMGTTLVAGTGVTITVNDSADTVTVAAVPQESNTPYKGEWRPLTEIANHDFMTGVPSVFTQTPRITLPPNPGGAGAPPQSQVVMIGYFNNAYDPFQGALQATVPAEGTRVRFTWTAPSTNTYGTARFLKNGGLIKQSAANTAIPWTIEEYSVAAGDVLRWDTVQAFSSTNPIYMSSVVFLGPALTYNLHDVVSYLGQLWESSVNNNSETPGIGSLWVVVTEADPDMVTSTTVDKIVTLTQAAYTALTPKVATTVYLIVG